MNENSRNRFSKFVPLAAAVAISITLVLLFVQVRQNANAIRDAAQSVSAQTGSLRTLASENQDLRALTDPKVILIIGDGMDDQQITMARNYLAGSHGRLNLDRMPFRGAALALGVSEKDPSMPIYISDSANTATALAGGVVTSPKRIATTAGTDEDIVTIMEMANAAGVGTGIVTTASVTDATPAAFIAHINNRLCQAPVDMVKMDYDIAYNNRDCSADLRMNGGGGAIAEQIAQADVNVVFGGGSGFFEHASELDPKTSLAELAESNGYEIID
ncbi:MAG: alkaline phosphatase, partial [Woeseiaceae bacterium]